MESPASIAEQLQELEAFYNAAYLARLNTYSQTAAIALLGYDVFINIGNEVNHVWAAWAWLDNIGNYVIFTTICNIILVLRIHAIYDQSKKVLVFMTAMMICQFILEFSTTIWNATELKARPAPPLYPGCLANSPLRAATLLSWIPNIVVAGVCVGLSLYRVFTGPDGEWRRHRTLSPLLKTFMRDGTLFFATVLDYIRRYDYRNLNSPLAPFALPWVTVVYSIGSTRMILNLRMTAKSSTSQETATLGRITDLTSNASSLATAVFRTNPRAGFSEDVEMDSVKPGRWREWDATQNDA
ncbi:uncharacterized protein BXZ73DRAFT_106422 [Epithele typhae]|uniref:uncharacterized protein n=1 Tax=Epithele typhae TaxID=378194 RepID=UPI00200853F1|nr:uncharacterized protein BXZ73DRAFT_106422 [Epithele typhae]KAH9914913.1 hypothetical protein BXZ73DRAFT_106422 [Epithele typhae]